MPDDIALQVAWVGGVAGAVSALGVTFLGILADAAKMFVAGRAQTRRQSLRELRSAYFGFSCRVERFHSWAAQGVLHAPEDGDERDVYFGSPTWTGSLLDRTRALSIAANRVFLLEDDKQAAGKLRAVLTNIDPFVDATTRSGPDAFTKTIGAINKLVDTLMRTPGRLVDGPRDEALG